jgi:hypothetical protein
MPMPVTDQGSRILLSTYTSSNASGENFIGEHMFSYQDSGSLTINDGEKVNTFNPGDFRLSVRNKLAKFLKQAPPNGEYRSVSVAFGQTFLREFALEYGYKAHQQHGHEPVILLQPDTHYQDYFASFLTLTNRPKLISLLTWSRISGSI